MVRPIELLFNDLNKIITLIKKEKGSHALIYSDDADGISSAIILSLLLDRFSCSYKFICLDKFYPELVPDILNIVDGLIFILDIGGPIYKFIPDEFKSRVIIFDHHQEHLEIPSDILYVNPHRYGFKEDQIPPTSVLTYMLYRLLDRSSAMKWAWLALIGIGELTYELQGLNWTILYDGLKAKCIVKSDHGFKICYGGIKKDYKSLYKDITLVISVGYFESELPIRIIPYIIRGDYHRIHELAVRYSEVRKRAFNNLLSILEKEGLLVKESIQWFEDFNQDFYNMGTRVFDSFTTYVAHQSRLLDKFKYLIGLQLRNPYIPGFGYLTMDWINIAVRVPKALEVKIVTKKAQPVSALIEASTIPLGGLGYGYETKGAGVIPYAEKEEFIRLFNELASGSI